MLYDKGDYHLKTVEKYGLPEAHAYHHTLYFLRWLIEHDLTSDGFRSETTPMDPAAVTNEGVLRAYEWWDCCLADLMLSEQGNVFAEHYFDFDKGRYISDYIALLQGELPSEFHIPLTEENYQKLKQVIDRRFLEWNGGKQSPSSKPISPKGGSSKPKRWWEFWRR